MFSSDEEALEAVKTWWKENGGFIIAGLVIGIALIAGWRFWQASLESESREAANLYEQVNMAVGAGDHDRVMSLTDQLRNDYHRNGYASQAALRAAAVAVATGDLDEAVDQLDWVIANAGDRELVKLARVRLARVHLDRDAADQALAVLDIDEPGRFAPLFNELRGDALSAQGDYRAAREAYGRAMATDDDEFTPRRELELKYHDLAGYED